MLSLHSNTHESFVYHISKDPLTNSARIRSIGQEKRMSTDYYWDGRLRQNDQNTFIFQYTLAGKGEMYINKKRYDLTPGKAFMVSVPSDHCYYLPEQSKEWTFLFITLEGEKASECWNYMSKEFGPIVKASAHSPLILLLQKIYQFALTEGIHDTFTSSAYAYEFLMGLYRFAKGLDKPVQTISPDLQKAVEFMDAFYHKPITLEEIAHESGLSKFYFTNKFQKEMNTTPIQFLTKKRMQKAMELLLSTNKTIHNIALETGYDNANYFSKVFKKTTGMTADSFRKDKKMPDYQHVIIDSSQ